MHGCTMERYKDTWAVWVQETNFRGAKGQMLSPLDRVIPTVSPCLVPFPKLLNYPFKELPFTLV